MNRRLSDPQYLKFFAPLNNFTNDVINNLTGTATSITYTANPQGKFVSTYNGSSSKIAFGNVNSSIKSVSFWVKLNTTTQKILELSGTVNIDITSETIGTTGWTSPTVYVDGAITSTISDTLWHFVTVTSTTAVNASAVNLGVIGASYGNIQLFNVRFYSIVLTGAEVSNLYNLEQKIPKIQQIEQPVDILPNINDTNLIGSWLNKKTTLGNDYSNSYRNLTTVNSVVLGKNGAYFSGANDSRIYATGLTALTNTLSYTVSAWVKRSSNPSASKAVFMGSSTRVSLGHDSSSKWFIQFVDTSSTTYSAIDTTALINNQWYCLVGVLDRTSGNVYLYVDGILKATTAWGANNLHGTITSSGIGGHPDVTNNSLFNGYVKDVRLYNTAQSSNWIYQEFKKGVPDSSLLFATIGGDKDLSRFSRSITNTNTVVGKEMTFSYANSSLNVGSDWIGVTNISVLCWINQNGFGGGGVGRILDNAKFILRMQTSGSKFELLSDGSTISGSANSSISNSKWIFVTITRTTTGTTNLYIDGILSGTANQSSGTPAAGTSNIFIGNETGGTRAFDGKISNLKVFNRILSTAEIYKEYIKTRNNY